jgi:hypothetical protein
MPTDTPAPTRPAATAPDGDADDDDDDAPAGDASGSKQTAPAGDDDSDDTDYREKFLSERRERRRLARRLTETRTAASQTPDLEQAKATAERERDEARAELTQERVYNRLVTEAVKQGAVDPDVVASLLATSDELDIDDRGRPTNVPDVVKDLLKRKPYLATKASPQAPRSGDAGAGRSGEAQNTDFNSAFRRQAAKHG